jgi:hypothetical protein
MTETLSDMDRAELRRLLNGHRPPPGK